MHVVQDEKVQLSDISDRLYIYTNILFIYYELQMLSQPQLTEVSATFQIHV